MRESQRDGPRVDIATLPPTQYLLLEVLAARHRLGEKVWTLPSRTRGTASRLEVTGLVATKDGPVEHTYLAWLTDRGREAVLSDSYVAPIVRDLEQAVRELEQAVAVLRAEQDGVIAALDQITDDVKALR